MLTKDSNDKEILDYPLGGMTIREIGAMSFMGWVASKLNGADTYKAATQELLMLVKNTPIGKMPDNG